MFDKIPVDKLYHPGVVVHNARETARNYAEVFDINKWRVAHYKDDRLANTTTRGLKANHDYTVAYGTHEETGITIQLVEPHAGDFSSYTEFMCTKGAGIHNLCTSIVTGEAFPELRDWFQEQGISVGQTATVDDAVDWYFFDTRDQLGGYHILVVVPRSEDWVNALKWDEEWDFTSEIKRPEGVGPVPLQQVYHFGVVVENVVDKMTNYANLFGFEEVTFMDIGTENADPRSPNPTITLHNPTYYGKPVEHRLFNSVTPLADFGFEIIQTTVGPIHYKEDFLERVGPGIHHFFPCMLETDDEWNKLNDWMNSIGAPMVQSGDPCRGEVKGLGSYYYWDTREMLGGYVLEVLLTRPGFYDSIGSGAPAFAMNFPAKA